MTRRLVRVERGGRIEEVDLDEVLVGDLVERAAANANAWIKSLRHAIVDERPFRDRFTYRGDSLWWFAELFLHKEGLVEAWWRTALALDAICASRQPGALGADPRDRILAHLVPQAAARHGCRVLSSSAETSESSGRLTKAVKGRFYTWSALASRWARPGGSSADVPAGGTLAFVHAAFWRRSTTAGAATADADGEEGYIGPVLEALARDGRAAPVRLVGVGPTKNFRARRWWHPLLPSTRAARATMPVIPVERFATRKGLEGLTGVWQARHRHTHALVTSEDLRTRALANGYDVWPLLVDELRGIAELQFPWSARAMDEAAAALDACRPAVAMTYAEAGGWGRALVLEARRRGIPSVGLQHGFIYRHWLNYRHEVDEMQVSRTNENDCGFPRPDLTLLFDGYAAAHLKSAGHFPPSSLRVTGSPALDRLAAALTTVDEDSRALARRVVGVDDNHVALVVSKFSQIRRVLPALIDAVGRTPGVALVIKPHPAETAQPYEAAARGARRVHISPPAVDLAGLLSVTRALVTVNSTVAIDAMVLGIPALVVGLPNNLSPFVDAGVMAGVYTGPLAAEALTRLCLDEPWRARLLESARRFALEWGIGADGQAAQRAADAIGGLASRLGGRESEGRGRESLFD